MGSGGGRFSERNWFRILIALSFFFFLGKLPTLTRPATLILRSQFCLDTLVFYASNAGSRPYICTDSPATQGWMFVIIMELIQAFILIFEFVEVQNPEYVNEVLSVTEYFTLL